MPGFPESSGGRGYGEETLRCAENSRMASTREPNSDALSRWSLTPTPALSYTQPASQFHMGSPASLNLACGGEQRPPPKPPDNRQRERGPRQARFWLVGADRKGG
jgi:hypothetical protein